MRNKFEAQLLRLSAELTEMGGLIESAIASAIKSLEENDRMAAEHTFLCEKEINQKEKDIESLCLKLLLQQQPVAGDLRKISAALKMITDMERIGDQAYDIAEIALTASGGIIGNIKEMAAETIQMVNTSVDAFVNTSINLAEEVIKNDDRVDELFELVKQDLTEIIRKDTENSGKTMDLLLIAKYLERIGDHAVNIAEWVEFSITGCHCDIKN